MIKIGVCDDEKNIRSYLISLIKEQKVECEILEYSSTDDYLSGGAEVDLLFLDIELGGSVSGLELAEHIRNLQQIRQPVIIFVTGYEKYVYDAFDVDAFQYLVKPVNKQKFTTVLGRALDRISAEQGALKKTIVIQYAGTVKVIPVDSIYYMESRGHKIVLCTKDGKLEYYSKISDLERELQGQFCRIHKGYLINLAHVDGYSRTAVTLENEVALPLSKHKYGDFVKAYLRFMREGEFIGREGLCHGARHGSEH